MMSFERWSKWKRKKEEEKQEVEIGGGAKRALVGVGARVLFYPTLLYNLLRNKIQPGHFRWWDQVSQFLLLGAVPFPKDVLRLKKLGVGGVITLNEPFETLVPPSLYQKHGIDHLVIPTRDYMYASSFADINKAMEFIHDNACCGRKTYIHCKAGRGRSTTVAICYLVKFEEMTPATALELIRSRRPRVLLHPSQMEAVQAYYRCCIGASSAQFMPSDSALVTGADLAGKKGFHAGKKCTNEPEPVSVVSNLDGHKGNLDSGRQRMQETMSTSRKALPFISRLSCFY